MEGTELVPFSEDLLPAWADLHNAAFAGQHNFWRVSARVLRRRIVMAPRFTDTTLLFARRDGRLEGFAHAGPGKQAPELFAIGVHPEARRGGIGTALVAALRGQLGEMRVESRGMNAFWGNARGPETCFFGMVEGIGVDESDKAALGFFASIGATPGPAAINLRVTPQTLYLEPGRDARKRAEMLGYEFGLLRGRCPALGGDMQSMLPLAGQGYFTAVASQGGIVAGICTAFPTPELGPGRFGIFSLESLPEHRRRGLGSALAMHVLLEMQAGVFTACEVTTVPVESPGAAELYERLGFESCARFALLR